MGYEKNGEVNNVDIFPVKFTVLQQQFDTRYVAGVIYPMEIGGYLTNQLFSFRRAMSNKYSRTHVDSVRGAII